MKWVKTYKQDKQITQRRYQSGDIIQYDLTTEGNKENLMIKFFREDAKTRNVKGPLPELALIDRRIPNPDHRVRVSQSQAGSYCMIIGNDDGGVLSNIKGTIEITKGKENDYHG